MKFGLTGNPLGHSYSEIIHNGLFGIKNVDFSYKLYPTEDFAGFFTRTLSNLDGFNVTIPYKSEVIKYLDFIDDKVKLYNACNTVVRCDGKYYGYNTDVNGFLDTLKKCNITLSGKKVLVLGSGGVARMMTFECVLNGAEVYITSRNAVNCNKIREEVAQKLNKSVTVITGDDIGYFDVVLNGTPCGMYPNVFSMPVPFEKIKDTPFVFDTVYNPKETLIAKMAKYYGNGAENGLYMLVEQAAAAQNYFANLQYSANDIENIKDQIDISPINLGKNIILIGPPGSGKSTVGREIASILNLEFVDIDSEIEKQHGNISQIFDKYGEKHFRDIESNMLKKYADMNNMLISTGGGAVETAEAMEYVKTKENTIVLFVNPSFEVLLKRTSSSDKRPLLKGDASSKLSNLLSRRLPMYHKYCDYKVDISNEQPIKLTVVQCIDKLCGF